MGGLMSGFQGRRKLTVEEVLNLKASTLCIKKGSKYVAEINWNNKEKSSIRLVKLNDDEVVLQYAVSKNGNKTSLKYEVGIEFTPCNYGGERVWFLCPGCGERVQKLYLKNEYFKCRSCQDLNYILQQENKRYYEIRRIERKMYAIQDKLKFKRNLNSIYGISKPKGMHYETYETLIRQLWKLYIDRWNRIEANLLLSIKNIEKKFPSRQVEDPYKTA